MMRMLRLGALAMAAGLLGCQASADVDTVRSRHGKQARLAGAAKSPGPSVPGFSVPRHAEETRSGLRSLVLRPGTGAGGAELHDEVTLIMAAWTRDGRPIAGLTSRGRPRRLAMRALFLGLGEGVGQMREGERRRLWIPAPLVRGGVLHSASHDLVMDVDLVRIHRGRPPPTTPAKLSAPPDAARTDTGLVYRILEAGTGNRHPAVSDRVRIDYAAWTSQGVLFRTTYGRGPSTVRVSDLIAGWSEGVQRMVEGELTRFWIPEALAYQGQAGQPRGTLVFDVRLLEILPAH